MTSSKLSITALVFSVLALAAWTNQALTGGTVPTLLQAPNRAVEQVVNKTAASAPRGAGITLLNNPNLVADVAEQVAPSVVNIDVERTTTPVNDADVFQRFFGFDPTEGGGEGASGNPFFQFKAPPQKVTGNGSGVILDTQGHILTNNHVIAGMQTIVVTLKDGRKCPAKIIGTDKYSDLAVLKISADRLTPALFASSSTLRPGEWVIAVGSPLGFDHTVTVGIISAISRRVPDLNANVDYIQTDAAINPGNSGGPLLNLRGEVVGINTAISGRAQNIGFAIPADVVKEVTTALLKDGSVNRPWVGISMAPGQPELWKSLGLPSNTIGVVVAQVIPNSPAAKAGLQQGDVVQHINGKVISDPKAVQTLVQTSPIGTALNMQVLRDGRMVAVVVKTEKQD